ncbi:efflux RND transporter periplasmic adaptor subunit [bacterium]|jgi:multidrug resistance efflux pump|nr:efflux RND transporter periplasmic adaptor subunit [bacterium]
MDEKKMNGEKEVIPELREEIGSQKPDLFRVSEKERKRIRKIYYIKLSVFLVFLCVLGLTPINKNISGIARVIPEKYSYIDAFQEGIIFSVNVKEGDKVEKGDLLFEIRNLELLSEMDTSYEEEVILKEEIQKLEGEISWHRKVLDRNVNLYNEEVIAPAELELTRLKYNNARHELEIKKQELEIVLKRRGYLQKCIEMTKVKSPIAGIVIGKLSDKLFTVAEKGERICQVADTTKFILEFPVHEKRIRYAGVGQPVSVKFYAFPNKVFQGELTEIRPIFWEKEKKLIITENVINVYIDFKEQVPYELKTGMSAFVNIHAGKTCFFGLIREKITYLFSM